MAARDYLEILADLEHDEKWVDINDAIELIGLAGFVLAWQVGDDREYQHHQSGESLYLKSRSKLIHPKAGQGIALKIRNYWPP